MSFRNRRSIRDFSYKFLLRNEYCYNQNVLWELKNFISNSICIRHYRKNDATSTLSINEFMNFNELYQTNQSKCALGIEKFYKQQYMHTSLSKKWCNQHFINQWIYELQWIISNKSIQWMLIKTITHFLSALPGVEWVCWVSCSCRSRGSGAIVPSCFRGLCIPLRGNLLCILFISSWWIWNF